MPPNRGLDPAARQRIGERLREQRKGRELTQKMAAHRLHVTQPAVAQWETGATLPTVAMQHAVAELYLTTRRYLFVELVALEERAA